MAVIDLDLIDSFSMVKNTPPNLLETLSLYLRQLRVLVLKCTSAVRTIDFICTCMNQLEYVIYWGGFPGKGGCMN